MITTSQRDTRISVERKTVVRDSHNEETATWAVHAPAYAAVRWGTGAERIEAAQVAGNQSATFIVNSTAKMREVTIEDRIVLRGDAWNIEAVATPVRGEIHFTASRSV